MCTPGRVSFARSTCQEGSSSLSLLPIRSTPQGLDRDTFAVRAGHYLGELNAIHPFRDGNGRTQRELVRELAWAGGHVLRWGRVPPERMNEASRISFERGDNSGLAELVRVALIDSTRR